jgi:chorismate mutase/prephenate dehydratase
MANTTELSASAADQAASLSRLRERIDTIDEKVHHLLMERASTIDALIAAKKSGSSGAAFRPAREADMMRRLAARHSGTLPLSAIEHCWREIISTFTFLQAPFGVHVHDANGAELRDLARFQFGFSVSLQSHSSAHSVVAAVRNSAQDLGLIALRGEREFRWWSDLDAGTGPMVIARLPFLTQPPGAAMPPAVVLSTPLSEPADPEMSVYAATWTGAPTWPDDLAETLIGVESGGIWDGLVAARATREPSQLRAAAGAAGLAVHSMKPVGTYAAPVLE